MVAIKSFPWNLCSAAFSTVDQEIINANPTQKETEYIVNKLLNDIEIIYFIQNYLLDKKKSYTY